MAETSKKSQVHWTRSVDACQWLFGFLSPTALKLAERSESGAGALTQSVQWSRRLHAAQTMLFTVLGVHECRDQLPRLIETTIGWMILLNELSPEGENRTWKLRSCAGGRAWNLSLEFEDGSWSKARYVRPWPMCCISARPREMAPLHGLQIVREAVSILERLVISFGLLSECTIQRRLAMFAFVTSDRSRTGVCRFLLCILLRCIWLLMNLLRPICILKRY